MSCETVNGALWFAIFILFTGVIFMYVYTEPFSPKQPPAPPPPRKKMFRRPSRLCPRHKQYSIAKMTIMVGGNECDMCKVEIKK